MGINELLYYAQRGDELSYKIIIKKYNNYLSKICWNYLHKHNSIFLDFTTLFIRAKFILNQSIYHYQEIRGTTFKTFFINNIIHDFNNKIRWAYNNRNNTLTTAVSYDETTYGLNYIVDYRYDPAKQLVVAENKTRYDKILNSFTGKRKQLLELWSEGYTYKEIGIKVNENEKWVDNTLFYLLKKLKKDYS